jgi:hypothetical protein
MITAFPALVVANPHDGAAAPCRIRKQPHVVAAVHDLETEILDVAAR